MEKNKSILSSRAQNAAKKIKDYFTRRPVGGQILEKNYYMWDNFKHQCNDYRIQMSPDGIEHILKLANMIDAVFFPIAKASGLAPINFTEERIDNLLEAVKNNKDWMNETDRLHTDIINKTDKKLVIQVSKN